MEPWVRRGSVESLRSVSTLSAGAKRVSPEERPQPHAELLREQLSRLREILGYDQAERDGGTEPTTRSEINDAQLRNGVAVSRNKVALPAELVASKAHIDELLQQLRTTDRLEAVADLHSWFSKTTPELQSSLQELTLAQEILQRTSEDLNKSSADHAMMLLQEDCVRTLESLCKVQHRLKEERRRGLIEGAEEQRQRLLEELSKMAWEEHVGRVQLQDTQERLTQLQDDYYGMIKELPPGVEYSAINKDITMSVAEQNRLNELWERLNEWSARLQALNDSTREKSDKTCDLREILQVMKQPPEDDESVHLRTPLQAMAKEMQAGIHPDRLEALKSCNEQWLEELARAKRENSQATALKRKATALKKRALAMQTSSGGEAIPTSDMLAAQVDTISYPSTASCSSSGSTEDELESFAREKAAHDMNTQKLTMELERLVMLQRAEQLRTARSDERRGCAREEVMSLEEAEQTVRSQLSQGIQRLLTEDRKAAIEAVEHSLSEQQQQQQQQHGNQQQQTLSSMAAASTDSLGMIGGAANTREADIHSDGATVASYRQRLETSLQCTDSHLSPDVCAQFLWPQSGALPPGSRLRRVSKKNTKLLRNLAPTLMRDRGRRNTRMQSRLNNIDEEQDQKHNLNLRIVDAGNLDEACDKLWEKAEAIEALLVHGSDDADSGGCPSRLGSEASRAQSRTSTYHGDERLLASLLEDDFTFAFVVGAEDDMAFERVGTACAHLARLGVLMTLTTPGGVPEAHLAQLLGPSQIPLCVFTREAWKLWLVSITIRPLGSSGTWAGRAVSGAWKATLPDGGSSAVVRFSLSREFLTASSVATSFELNARTRPTHELKLIERHYFKDRLISSHMVEAPFAVPGAKSSTWEVLQERPLLDEDVKAEMIASPWETRSDSFFLVENKLVLHCRCVYSFQE